MAIKEDMSGIYCTAPGCHIIKKFPTNYCQFHQDYEERHPPPDPTDDATEDLEEHEETIP